MMGEDGKRIVAVVPKKLHHGGTWVREVVTVYFQERDGGKITYETLVWKELTQKMKILFDIGELVNRQLIKAAEEMFSEKENDGREI